MLKVYNYMKTFNILGTEKKKKEKIIYLNICIRKIFKKKNVIRLENIFK